MPTLEWIGKEKVVNHHQEVPFRILDKKYTFNVENSENMIIHGDNLLALKSLLPKYEGLIDCIYIDPPYNTGKKEGQWVYSDTIYLHDRFAISRLRKMTVSGYFKNF